MMNYRLLGNSGLKVSEICLGTSTFGEEWGWGASKEDSRKIFQTYVEGGGNFIDTANEYTEGTSEKYVGEFIKQQRERFVLATKYTLADRPGDPNSAGNNRKNLFQSVEGSLRRINTDYIDLLWLHIWDFLTPVEEIMRALDDLIRSGKVFYLGVSDTPAWIVSQANTLARLMGWTPFIALQVEYSLVQRTPEREYLPMAQNLDIALLAWGPLGGGILSGKYRKPGDAPAVRRQHLRLTEKTFKIAAAVRQTASEMGCTSSQVALNWIRQQRGVVIPIVGVRKASQLEENLKCLEFRLTREQIDSLNEVSRIELGFPYEFYSNPLIVERVYAGVASRIDNHRKPLGEL